MQQRDLKKINSELAFQWLKIVAGAFFLGFAAYRFVGHGYDWRAVKIGLTVVFGMIIPAVALANIIQLKKEKKNVIEENTWQDPEIC